MTRLQEIIIGKADRSKEIKKLESQGLIRKIAPRVYTSDLTESREKIIRRNWYRLISDLSLIPYSVIEARWNVFRQPKGMFT